LLLCFLLRLPCRDSDSELSELSVLLSLLLLLLLLLLLSSLEISVSCLAPAASTAPFSITCTVKCAQRHAQH
jgi:hypothetical protein